MFHTFKSREERRAFGGSAFIEFQFCRIKSGADISKIVSASSIDHWLNDSLYIYIDDTENFINEYGEIFDCGVYSNLESGPVDICGINYYSPELTEEIREKIYKAKPADHEVISEWLREAEKYNGFYILGL